MAEKKINEIKPGDQLTLTGVGLVTVDAVRVDQCVMGEDWIRSLGVTSLVVGDEVYTYGSNAPAGAVGREQRPKARGASKPKAKAGAKTEAAPTPRKRRTKAEMEAARSGITTTVDIFAEDEPADD